MKLGALYLFALLVCVAACDSQSSEDSPRDVAADTGDSAGDLRPDADIAPGDADVQSDVDIVDTDAAIDLVDGTDAPADQDMPPDVPVDIGDECVDDSGCAMPDTGCWQGRCIGHCAPPLRMIPTTGPDTGRTRILVRGMEFYIGALDWWANFDGQGTAGTVYDGTVPQSCTIAFYAPPMPAGDYPVTVYYGEPSILPPMDPGRGGNAGIWTSTTSTESMGSTQCTDNVMCAMDEVCERGLGKCVLDICQRTACVDGWTWGNCEQAMGCVPEPLRCGSALDCRMIYSSCGCQAVHVTDPRTALTSYGLGAGELCFANHCDLENLDVACVDGICVEN